MTIIRPPFLTTRATSQNSFDGCTMCSITSPIKALSNVPSSKGMSVASMQLNVTWRVTCSGSSAKRFLAYSSEGSSMSMPVTVCPSRPRIIEAIPWLHPTSRTLAPSAWEQSQWIRLRQARCSSSSHIFPWYNSPTWSLLAIFAASPSPCYLTGML